MWRLGNWLARRKATRAISLEIELLQCKQREQRTIELAREYQAKNRKLALTNRELQAELRGVKSTIAMFLESTPLWPAIRSMIGENPHDGR